MDITDLETIAYDGTHSGKHTKGLAVEHFDLVICAIHKPLEPFSDGQQLKEFVSGIQTDDLYTVTVNPFTRTNLDQCGDLIITVTYSSNADHGVLTSPTANDVLTSDTTKIYSQSLDKLTHTFDRTWRLSPQMEFSVSLTFAYANAPGKG